MFLKRTHLRTPALIAWGLLLLTGARDALGVESCLHHLGGASHAAMEHGAAIVGGSDAAHSTASGDEEADHQHHHSHPPHAGHGDDGSHAGVSEPSAFTPIPDGAAHEEHGSCDCQFLCVAGAPGVLLGEHGLPSESAGLPPRDLAPAVAFLNVGVLHPTLVPHFLPFPNGPPADA